MNQNDRDKLDAFYLAATQLLSLKEYLKNNDVSTRNRNNQSLLMIASMDASDPEIIKVLVSAGADIEERDEDDLTPIMLLARDNYFPRMIYALIEAKADIHAKNKHGMTAFMLASEYSKNKEILKVLLDLGIDINKGDKSKNTPLTYALCNNFITVQFLIDNGANVNAQNLYGETPLSKAIRHKINEKIIQLLINKGAKESKNRRKSILS